MSARSVDRGDDAAVDLLERDELVVEANTTWRQLLGVRLHQRFEADLGKVGRELRAGRHPVGIVAAGAPRLLGEQDAASVGVAGEAGVERRASQLLRRRADCVDRVGDTAIVEHLHGPLAEDVGLGQHRGVGEGAHELVVDPHLGEQHRSGEASAAPAHDEHVRRQLVPVLALGHCVPPDFPYPTFSHRVAAAIKDICYNNIRGNM